MSNMSYCRFHNTLGDLQDCKDAIEEMAENIHNKRAYDELLPKWKAARDIEDPTEDQELDCDEMFEELDRLRDQTSPPAMAEPVSINNTSKIKTADTLFIIFSNSLIVYYLADSTPKCN